MQTKHVLTSIEVTALMAAARAEAAHRKLSVSIAVVDDGGHPLALERTDDAAPVTAYVAIEKARTAALCRRESKAFEDMINGGRVAWLSVPVLSGILEGGVPVIVDGHVLGAVGVSGASPADDASIGQCAADAVLR
ncbi:heme-binding protein [Paraburkholderia sp. 2C]|jgi:glc operon protein GlcG